MTVVINGTTGISGVDGSAGTPAVQGTDTNTGVFYPAADTVAVSTGGSERMRVDSSGNVGIGTSSPNSIANYSILQVGGSSTTQGYIETYDGTTRTVMWTTGGVGKIGTRTSHPLTFQINSSEVARIDTSGNLQFNSGYGSVATAYGCRAWVNFNGTGTVAIRASGNVTSITDNGTGDYTINFTNAMPDANYSAVVTAGRSDNRNGNGNILPSSSAPATGSVRIGTSIMSNSDALDIAYIMVAVFR